MEHVEQVGLQRLGPNTWRQVDTRFFDNPLSGVTAKAARGKRAIEVKVAFKNPKDARQATVSTKTEVDGMYYAYLTFPPGTAMPEPAATKSGGDVEK